MDISRSQLEKIIREVVREVESKETRPSEAAAAAEAAAPVSITPAKIGIGRTGSRYLTGKSLDFQLAHAAARDAVLGEVPDELVQKMGLITATTQADTKDAFLTNPELGRHLSDEGRETVSREGVKGAKLQVIVIDGLSSTGMVTNLQALMEGISKLGYPLGKPVFVKHGRLSVTNEVGDLLTPDAAVSLVGERPGLVTAESVSAYITYKPSSKTTEADRNLISNIYAGGTTVPQALDNLAGLLKSVYAQGISGVNLK